MLEYLSFLLHLNSELTAQYASIYSKVCIMRLIILKDAPELSDFVQYIANQNMTKKNKIYNTSKEHDDDDDDDDDNVLQFIWHIFYTVLQLGVIKHLQCTQIYRQ